MEKSTDMEKSTVGDAPGYKCIGHTIIDADTLQLLIGYSGEPVKKTRQSVDVPPLLVVTPGHLGEAATT